MEQCDFRYLCTRLGGNNMAQEKTVLVDVWDIPVDEAETYITKRNEMKEFFLKECPPRFSQIENDGEGYEEGEYIAAENFQTGEQLFVLLDPIELDHYQSWDDKEAYLENIIWHQAKIDYFYTESSNLGKYAKRTMEDWENWIKEQFESEFNQSYSGRYIR